MTGIKIGPQIWMSENLNVDCFSNGDPISDDSCADSERVQVADKRNGMFARCLKKIIN